MNEHRFFVIKDASIRKDAVKAVSDIKGEPLMQVEIKKYTKNRSAAQNRLMWMWNAVITEFICGEVTKESREEMHDLFKVRFLGVEERVVDGKKLSIPVSTRTLSTKEFTQFLEKIEMLALELDIVLPYPTDYQYAMGGKL